MKNLDIKALKAMASLNCPKCGKPVEAILDNGIPQYKDC